MQQPKGKSRGKNSNATQAHGMGEGEGKRLNRGECRAGKWTSASEKQGRGGRRNGLRSTQSSAHAELRACAKGGEKNMQADHNLGMEMQGWVL